jgi:hypothetical protein
MATFRGHWWLQLQELSIQSIRDGALGQHVFCLLPLPATHMLPSQQSSTAPGVHTNGVHVTLAPAA